MEIKKVNGKHLGYVEDAFYAEIYNDDGVAIAIVLDGIEACPSYDHKRTCRMIQHMEKVYNTIEYLINNSSINKDFKGIAPGTFEDLKEIANYIEHGDKEKPDKTIKLYQIIERSHYAPAGEMIKLVPIDVPLSEAKRLGLNKE